MGIRDALSKILQEAPIARNEVFAGHPLAGYLRREAGEEIRSRLGAHGTGMVIAGSGGAGRWADVPWIGIFDPVVTSSATRGYYAVYLFHATQPVVHLSLNQGATAVREEFKSQAPKILRDRAMFMRDRVRDFAPQLPVTTIDLGSPSLLPLDYEAGHALGRTYGLGDLPSEDDLRADLISAVQAYRALTFRGGLEADIREEEDTEGENGATLLERRRYRLHARIERNPKAALLAKKYHGTGCQTCGLQFAERYGPIGVGFIEVHHLRPISSLDEGLAVRYNVASDFAVLCSKPSDDPQDR